MMGGMGKGMDGGMGNWDGGWDGGMGGGKGWDGGMGGKGGGDAGVSASGETCQFFVRSGWCKFGDACRHQHIPGPNTPQLSQEQQMEQMMKGGGMPMKGKGKDTGKGKGASSQDPFMKMMIAKGKAKGKGKVETKISLGEPAFYGKLRTYDAERGAGTISCAEVYAISGQEVYIHRSVLEQRGAGLGDTLVFLVHWNTRGQPQCSMESLRIHSTQGMALKGTVKAGHDPAKGFSHLECPEAHEFFGRDIYVDKEFAGGLAAGQAVAFNVKLDKDLNPEVEELTLIDESWVAQPGDLATSREDPNVLPAWEAVNALRPLAAQQGEQQPAGNSMDAAWSGDGGLMEDPAAKKPKLDGFDGGFDGGMGMDQAPAFQFPTLASSGGSFL